MSVLTQTGEGELSGGYLDGCQDGGRPKNPGRSLPRRVSGRRAAQKPRSVLTQTGRSLPKREKRALVLTWTDLPQRMTTTERTGIFFRT